MKKNLSVLANQLFGKIAGAFAGLALVLFFAAVNASAQCWTTAGSTGTVDEASLGVVELNPRIPHPFLFIFESSVAGVKSSAASANVGIYYNVVGLDELLINGYKNLTVRFGDNGLHSKVVVELKQKNILTGEVSTLTWLKSDDFPSPDPVQTQSIPFSFRFNFSENIYYIEASLIKTEVAGKPTIHAIKICGYVE